MRRRFKPLGVMLTAVGAVLVAGVGTAQAATFAMLPGKAPFTFESKAGTTTLLQTLSGKDIECEKVKGSGELKAEDGRLGMVEFKFSGCTTKVIGVTIKCTGLETGDKEGEILFKAEFHLRHLLNANNVAEHVSLMILVGHVHWECGGVLFLVLGSVCSDALENEPGGPTAENLLLASIYADFLIKAASTGDPSVAEVDTDNSLGMEKCELLTKEGTSETNKYESSAQRGEGFIKPNMGTVLIELSGTF